MNAIFLLLSKILRLLFVFFCCHEKKHFSKILEIELLYEEKSKKVFSNLFEEPLKSSFFKYFQQRRSQ